MANGQDRFKVDLYEEGSCIYRLDHEGEIESIAAWARSTIVASRTFEALVFSYPNQSFSQRRGSHIENNRVAAPRFVAMDGPRQTIQAAETIADHIAGGYEISAVCENNGNRLCGHRAVLDLEALGRKLGFDHGCLHAELAPRLRCSACGSRKISLRLSPQAPKVIR